MGTLKTRPRLYFFKIRLVFLFFRRNVNYLLAVVIAALSANFVRCFKFVALGAFYQVGRGNFPLRVSGVGSLFRSFTFLYCHFYLPSYLLLHLHSPSLRSQPHSGQSPLQSSLHKKVTGVFIIIISSTILDRSILPFTTG